MYEVSLFVLVEAGQIRSFATPAFRLPLPDTLLWGAEAIPRIEVQASEVDSWPPLENIECAVIVHRDDRRLLRAGASNTFDTPYQLKLFDRMLESVWPGYRIETIPMTSDALSSSIGRDTPPLDSSLSDRLYSNVWGEHDDGDDEDHDEESWPDEEDEVEDSSSGRPSDFRQLTLAQQLEQSSPEQDHDLSGDGRQWWVSVRFEPGEPFRHFLGSFVSEALATVGPELLSSLSQLPEVSIPPEDETVCGIVLDAPSQSIAYWSHPRNVIEIALAEGWSHWTVVPWLDNGFRRQLAGCDDQSFIPASDTEVLAGFLPQMAEQPDLSQWIGGIKSSVRSFVRKGFGCLALVLAVPAALAWAVSGSWQGPFAFAAGLWLVAYIGYRVLVAKIKRNLSPITDRKLDQDAILPKLAPEPQEERERLINAALAASGLPSLEQINSFAETMDDEEAEQVEPILRSVDPSERKNQ